MDSKASMTRDHEFNLIHPSFQTELFVPRIISCNPTNSRVRWRDRVYNICWGFNNYLKLLVEAREYIIYSINFFSMEHSKSCIDLVHTILVCTNLIILSTSQRLYLIVLDCTCQTKILTIIILLRLIHTKRVWTKSIQDFLKLQIEKIWQLQLATCLKQEFGTFFLSKLMM